MNIRSSDPEHACYVDLREAVAHDEANLVSPCAYSVRAPMTATEPGESARTCAARARAPRSSTART